mmetsp:Transcript_27252/g.30346  ORF Transcript_27252/g.30346 Transcript_27252/m.30346 type:complete len:356 (-) Transcript_27252:59-1126(-)
MLGDKGRKYHGAAGTGMCILTSWALLNSNQFFGPLPPIAYVLLTMAGNAFGLMLKSKAIDHGAMLGGALFGFAFTGIIALRRNGVGGRYLYGPGFEQKDYYFGDMQAGYPKGSGTLVSLTKPMAFVGNFRLGRKDGFGNQICPGANKGDAFAIQAEWDNGQFKADSDIAFSLIFNKTLRQTTAKAITPSSNGDGLWCDEQGVYDGELKHGRRTGKGMQISTDCVIHGEWKHNHLAKGRIETDRFDYEGGFDIFDYYVFSGEGTLVNKIDGSKYVGSFAAGKRNGRGVYTLGDIELMGTFANGEPVKGFIKSLKTGRTVEVRYVHGQPVAINSAEQKYLSNIHAVEGVELNQETDI